ncbi:MAG TPA: SusC/RagA family TonB-linked outer membrane protein [Ohtaekwangia sp.]|nr:SusC/RagA family TonB-linked outer membrane protein [Ohtaekwangia sp.]
MTKFYLFSRYLTVLLIFITTTAWSQGRTVTGKVTSADDGSAIPGVNIVEKGTSNGTISSVDGSYTISVSPGAVLVFSFVGYSATEVSVGEQTTVNASLQADVTALSEVVVIGYGEVNRRDATGAVASVKAEDFNMGIISSPEQLIQGKTAGVQITQSSGEPGAGVNLRIRGTSSVRASNNPLFVVDGIPLSGGDISAGGADIGRGTSSAKNPLNFINPNDIESIDILKDASATAIYGSRGANGVVLVTTKNGKGKDTELEYAATFSISKQAKKFDLLSAQEFLEAYGTTGGDVSVFEKGGNTDWQDEINRTAFSHSHNLAFADSYKTGDYRVSVSLDDQEGVIKKSGMKRVTGRLNLNQSFLNEKLKLSTQILVSRVNDQAAPITNAAGFEGDLIGAAIMYNPAAPATSEQVMEGDISNPLALSKYFDDRTETDRQLINVSLGYDITDEFNFKVNTGFDRSQSFRDAGYSSSLRNMQGIRENGRAFFGDQENESDLLEAFLTYQKTFDNASINVIAGYSYQQFRNNGSFGQGWGFSDHRNSQMRKDLRESAEILGSYIDQDYQQYAYTGTTLVVYSLDPIGYETITPATAAVQHVGFPTIPVKSMFESTFANEDELQSFFGRVNYTLRDKYLFTASVRTDGSTKFAENNKYGVFPAAAFAWRLSEEDFMPDVFDDLKLRLGYGITGNQEIPHNLYQGRVRYNALSIVATEGGRIDVQGPSNVAFANPDLKWEQTSQLNVGIDFGFLQNRLYGSLDFYRKNTTDLLMQTISAQPAPNAFIWRNLPADVINSGIEVTINAVAVDKTDVGIDVGFNFAYNKNMVKNYDGSPLPTGRIHGQGLTGAFTQRIANNYPLYTYFVRPFTGYGDDGLNKPEEDQQIYVNKSPIPKYNLGFSLSLRYKNWDMATYLNGQFGHYIYNNVTNAFFTMGSINAGRNVTKSTIGTGESVANAPDVSTRFLEKGDFLRMQNLSIGYNFKLADDSFIKKIRISATGQNVFILTDYSGLDPEVNVDKNIDGVPSLGIDYTAYPRARSIVFGLNATF